MNAANLPNPDQTMRIIQQWRGNSGECAAVLANNGDAAPVLRRVGLLHWEQGRLDAAIASFRAALALTPRDASLWRDLACACASASDNASAEASIIASLAIDATNAGSWLTFAGLLDGRGDAEGAEQAYDVAIAIDPALAAAHLGRGIVLFKRQRLDGAAASLRTAIDCDAQSALAQSCLGHVLYLQADFGLSAAAFAAAARLGPLDAGSRRKHARAITFQAMIEGRIAEALAAYPRLAGADEEDLDLIARDAFSLLSAYGHTAAAAVLGGLRLATCPGDPVRRYLLDAVTGCALTRAPADYVESCFDRFAPDFDQTLVGVLQYRAPTVMHGLVTRHRTRFSRILDLGCGTGLAVDQLASLGGDVIGVDLSAGMLEQARKRGRYTGLVKADALTYLDQKPDGFELIFAADLFIYIGDLGGVIGSVARALVPGGLFALSLETSDDADYALLPSGRFAHAHRYVERLTGPHFEILDTLDDMLRLEANRPVRGRFLVLRRRCAVAAEPGARAA